MPQITQAEAVVTLESDAARMHALMTAVPEPEFERPATIGGGDWSTKDLGRAHLPDLEAFVESLR